MADLQLPYHNRLNMYAYREPVAAAVRAAADEAARATAELTATAIKHLQSVRARARGHACVRACMLDGYRCMVLLLLLLLLLAWDARRRC